MASSSMRTSYLAKALCLFLMAFALLCFVQAQPAHARALVAPTPVPSFDSHDAYASYVRRQDSSQGGDDTFNTSSSVLPISATEVHGQPSPTLSSSPHDPLLAIMPDFAFSMPAQLVVDGVILALTTMLTIQLIFTMQYHYPLSKKNYALQSFSTLMLLISIAVHLHTVLRSLEHQVHGWPYMFVYIAVQIPPQDGSWTVVQETFYLLMRAISTFSIHLTHIQFLTLLFPSALEARLILWMLGPLALVASGMEFTALSPDDDVKTSDLGDAIRNICNSTLFLLYTSGLLIWGLLVNRRRAWRTDGGTAAFGGGSVGLAFINTMVSFVEIAFDRLWWLPDILWTLTLWQSWLGFWWWVGSGMGIGEVEDRVERQERRRKREEKLRRKRERLEKQQLKATAAGTGSGTGGSQVAAVAASVENGSDAIIGGIRRIKTRLTGDGSLIRRARTTQSDATSGSGSGNHVAGEEIELDRVADANGAEQPLQSVAVDPNKDEEDDPQGREQDRRGAGDDAHTVAGSGSHSSDTHPTTSGAATSSVGWFGQVSDYMAAHQPDFIRRRMRRLRLAHVAAARRAATEQTMLRDQVLNRQSEPMGPGLRTMMFDTNRNSTQSPAASPLGLSMSRERERSLFGNALALEHTFSSSDSTAGRRDVLPVLLEGDPRAQRRRSSATSDANSTSSPHAAQRRLHVDTRAQSQRDASARRSQDPDWVDVEEENEEQLASVGRSRAQRGEQDEDDDTSSNVAHDGETDERAAGGATGPGQDSSSPSNPSWAWRGGLRSLRMRDRTTYD